MKPQEAERLTEIMAKGYDLSPDDATAIDILMVNLDYEEACRVADAVRLIICDPAYKGDVPHDYFD